MDRLTQIEAFVGALEHGSLARAAQVTGITPAMLGRRIDALEKRLGVKLLHRSTRRLAATEEGIAFVEACRKLLGELDAAEELITEGRQVAVGKLRITAPSGFGRRHVAAHVPAFLAAHPRVELSLDLTDRVVDLVREGLDLGIRIGNVLDPNLVAVRLSPNQRVVCAAPVYLERHGVPERPADLARHNCLAFNPHGGQQAGWQFMENGRPVTIRVRGNPDCNDGEMLHRWAREGLGLAWRSTWEIHADLARGALVTVLDDYRIPDYDVRAVYPQQRKVSAKVRLFVQHLKTIYATAGYWDRG